MWIINITQFKKSSDGLRVEFACDFSKDGITHSISFVESSKQALDNHLNEILLQLDRVDTFASELAIGTYTLAPKVEPTMDEIAKREFALKELELARLQTSVKLGTITQAEYDAKLAEVLATKPIIKVL